MKLEEELQVKNLLSSWGLPGEIVDTFIDQQMDLYALKYMDNDTINSLVPKMGLRIRFKQQRADWVQSLTNNSVHNNSHTSPELDSLTGNQQVKLIASKDLAGNLTEFPDCFMEGDAPCGTQPTPTPSSVELCDNSKSVHALKTSENPAPKKLKAYDLESVLKNSKTQGKLALAKFKKDGQFLKDSTRDDLVEAIIDSELGEDLTKEISRARMKYLAKEIVELFPTEVETTYFESYVNPKTNKYAVKGKLIWKYYNTRREYSKCGAITKQITTKNSAPIRISPTSRLQDYKIDKETRGSLLWLEQNRGNKNHWDDVCRHWKITSMARLKFLIFDTELDAQECEETEPCSCSKPSKKQTIFSKSKSSMKLLELKLMLKSAHSYMAQYPAFQESTGYMLMEIDFQTLRPEVNQFVLFTEWPVVSSFVVETLRKKHEDFLQDPTLTATEKNIKILRGMSKMFNIISVSGEGRNRCKKTWRPSHAESADAFVLVVPSMLALEEDKDAKRDLLKKYRMHMQPFVAVVGDIENPSQYLVCIDEFFYEVESILQAVDVVFKSFFTLHTPYPAEAGQLWLFLQKAVYGFSTEFDSVYTGLDSLMAEYERFKDKSCSS